MNKFLLLTFLSLMLVFAAACGTEETSNEPAENNEEAENEESSADGNKEEGVGEETAEGENEEANDEEAQDEEVSGDAAAVQELLENMQAAEEEINSGTAEISLSQNLNDGVEEMEVEGSMYLEFVADPISFYTKSEDTNSLTDETQETEVYLIDNVMYIKDLETEEWFKFPDEMAEDLIGSTEELEAYFDGDYEALMEFVEDITLEEDGDYYILNLTADSEEYLKLFEDLDMGFEGMDIAELFSELENLEYEIKVDQDTYLTEQVIIKLTATMAYEDEEVFLDQDMTINILDYNSVEEIELPEEALEAEELEMPDFDFDLEELEELEDLDPEELEELDLEELEEENDE